jgi:predicted phosphodiesterase
MRLHRGKDVVLVISDLHIPFQHPDAMYFLEDLKRLVRPTVVVGIGDSLDSHAMSRFVHDPDGMGAGDEIAKALEVFKRLFEIFPNVIEVESSHNDRGYRRAFDAGLPTAVLKPYRDMIHAPAGWTFEENAIIDNVLYEHGMAYGGKSAIEKAVLSNRMSVVMGHHHSMAGIHYFANRYETLFGMCVGCLIDLKQYAFNYAKKIAAKPILSCGVVVNGVPSLYPMFLDDNNRWTGEF